ncbi:unnamed protein product [Rhizophagus irregularis]|nr:unnamed protein product [Rhizophagus irregularis]
MIVSIISYKIRKTHASSILKIIFNFGQIVRNFGMICSFMTPKVATILQCTASIYVMFIGNISRLSLTAFLLLWRIRQIDMKSKDWDKRICILLFVIRTEFTIPYLIIQISVEYISILEARILFTAVTYWNFLRLIISFIFHLFAILDIFEILEESPSMTVKCIIYILLSYLITIDAEIVHAIEAIKSAANTVLKNENDEIKDDDENEDNDRKINDTEISNMEIITH